MLRIRAGSTPQTCRRGHHVLLTANLRLQTPTRQDMAIMSAAASDPEAQQWLGWPGNLLIPEPERDRLLAMEPGQGRGAGGYLDLVLCAVDRASGLVAGGAALDAYSLEAGRWLAPAFRGHGLGKELFAAIAQFGHDHLGMTRVGAGTEPANAACVAALLAAEFEPDQGPQVHHLHDGRTVPASWFRHDTRQPSRCRG
jgi:RimJ/RimL family protein N-acetyltransferase